jgi:cytochrome b involved in lipid metabolism
MKYYSYLEVVKHNKEDSCWIFVGRKIYDVTEFLNLHPGSKQAILKYAGYNVKISYNFHSKKAKKIWKKFFIGKLLKDDLVNIKKEFN